MQMTKQVYNNLKRFNTKWQMPFMKLVATLKIEEQQMFKCYDLSNSVRYLKVTNALNNICYDLKECDANGNWVRCPYKKGSVKRFEIATRLYQNDWFLLSI